jgi:molecular chaperone GrpE
VAEEKKENAKDYCEDAREEKLTELDILKQSLDEKRKQAEEYYDQILRLKADFENFRKRTERDKHNHILWGKEDILLKQLGILDILEKAHKSALSSTNIEAIRKGLELIIQEFLKMISSEGVEEIECLGKNFDPSLEEAVDYIESGEKENTVVEVLQKGYTSKQKLLRPAKVKVAKKK